ncbi:Calcineurin subunit B [Diplonema papillatum]|nr:Calcineurin subunit B [Diplonema papillatum]
MPVYSPEDEQVVADLTQQTAFSADEIRNMQDNFKKLAASKKDDGLIDREEFKEMLSSHGSSAFVNGLFRMFDADADGYVDFKEFVISLSVYQNKNKTITEEEKLNLLFKIYDVDQDGEISRDDLFTVLKSCLESNYLTLDDGAVGMLVDATMKKHQLSAKGGIDFTEYSKAFQHRAAICL